MITIVPISSGTPTRANSKKPKPPTPASEAASDTSTFTGVPVRASIEPAWAAKASGISSWLVGRRWRRASTTTIGSRAATAPLTLMIAVSERRQEHHRDEQPPPVAAGDGRQLLARPRRHARRVEGRADDEQRGDEQRPSGRRSRRAACPRSSTPVAASVSEAPIATISTGKRFQTKRTTVPASTHSTIADVRHEVTVRATRRRAKTRIGCFRPVVHRLLRRRPCNGPSSSVTTSIPCRRSGPLRTWRSRCAADAPAGVPVGYPVAERRRGAGRARRRRRRPRGRRVHRRGRLDARRAHRDGDRRRRRRRRHRRPRRPRVLRDAAGAFANATADARRGGVRAPGRASTRTPPRPRSSRGSSSPATGGRSSSRARPPCR